MTRSFLPNCEKKQEGQDRSGRRMPFGSGKQTVRNARGCGGKDVGRSECRPVAGWIPVRALPGTQPGSKGSPRPTGKPSQDSLKNHFLQGCAPRKKRKKAERACAPLISRQSVRIDGCKCVLRRRSDVDFVSGRASNFRAGQPAFGELEPYAGKLARTVLRGARGRQRPPTYSTGGRAAAPVSAFRNEPAAFEHSICHPLLQDYFVRRFERCVVIRRPT